MELFSSWALGSRLLFFLRKYGFTSKRKYENTVISFIRGFILFIMPPARVKQLHDVRFFCFIWGKIFKIQVSLVSFVGYFRVFVRRILAFSGWLPNIVVVLHHQVAAAFSKIIISRYARFLLSFFFSSFLLRTDFTILTSILS